ncbi:MFS general substrate transporter [Amylostereum chailletii]|nr:MFS general substrate transporter [Amylostereum chailletii]
MAKISKDEQRQIWRKLDLHLLPFVSILYLLSFLDRSNIGNARVAGMASDLDLHGLRYNIAAALFFIPYCFAEVPSNILLKLVRPSIWIPTTMVAWGTVMTLMCLVNTYRGLVISRIFLGLTEAGLFPGVTYYVSLWYPRRLQARRFAIFTSAATLAGAFGGILAFGIEHLEGKADLHGWQWIFLIEGLATIAVASVSYFLMSDAPDNAKFLSEHERNFVLATLSADSGNQVTHFDLKFVYQALADYKAWLQVLMFIGVLPPVYAVALFTPSIISSLGYSAARAQLLSIPPFVCGCFYTITAGVLSDHFHLRGPFIVLNSCVAMVGYILAYTTSAPGPGYAAAVFAAMGVYANIAITLAWAGGNAGGEVKRGTVIAMVIGMGNLGGICSSFVYNDPPRYHHGHGTMIGSLCLSVVCACVLMWRYRTLNRKKNEVCLREGITEDMEFEFRHMSDSSPLFR